MEFTENSISLNHNLITYNKDCALESVTGVIVIGLMLHLTGNSF